MKKQITYIYGLCDPRDGRIRYIGKSNCPRDRCAKHIRDAKKSTHTHKRAWIRGLLNDGLKPKIVNLMQIPKSDWRSVEFLLLKHLQDQGYDLVNEAIGGGGGVTRDKMSPERRKAISERTRSLWQDPAMRTKMIKGQSKPRGPLSPEGLAIFREKRKTWKPRLGMKNSPEQNAKIGAANAIALKGRNVSKEFKQHLDEIREQRWARPGERKQWSEQAKQRPRGPDGRFLKQSE